MLYLIPIQAKILMKLQQFYKISLISSLKFLIKINKSSRQALDNSLNTLKF